MHLYRTSNGPVLKRSDAFLLLSDHWDQLIIRDDLPSYLATVQGEPTSAPEAPLSPCTSQEVWAAGVTYFRSRTARMEESKDAGGGSFYDRVYAAERPEIFFKATPQRVAAPGAAMHLRRDSKWMVPEPEMTLVISAGGKLIGTTVGNDLSCRDIEGENPLYLPQAKCFRLSAALGPCIRVSAEPLSSETAIHLQILRSGVTAFEGQTTLAQLKRTPAELIAFLYRDNDFPQGAFLMTGTGIVPPDDFTLQPGDEVRISIDDIGTLSNLMA
ncbi:MAG: fumarylacetoacetate hydrolase family protein [Verrucomicrobiaceae bacterium]|nr:fumarylacetoacetate hydrolase family protein [Verrucomicrobiaceae bacterium]